MTEPRERMNVGEFRHNLDAKSRLSIPSKWRFKGDDEVEFLVFPHPDGCLMVLPPAEAERLRTTVLNQQLGDNAATRWQSKTFSQADSLMLDANGRITLPDRLKKRVGIEREVVLIGMVTKFAIWSPGQWAVMAPDESKDNFGQLMKQAGV